MSRSSDFAQRTSSHNKEIDHVFRAWDIFLIEQGTERERAQRKTEAKRRFRLLPPDEGEALLCMIVAGGDAQQAHHLETQIEFVEVVRMYALQQVMAWQPKR